MGGFEIINIIILNCIYKQDAKGERSFSAPGVAGCVHLPSPPEIKFASPLAERE